jgi:endonuclease IV
LKIEIGLKLWSTNTDVLPQAEELISKGIFKFIELTPFPNTSIEPFLEVKVPYVIHGSIDKFGFNLADKEKQDINFKRMVECIEWVNALKAKYCVIHPGYGLIDDALDFLKLLDDSRFLIENMPMLGLGDENMVGFSPEQIKQLTGEKFGFCLDLNHAIKASIKMRVDYKVFIEEFFKLSPKLLHISDGKLSSYKDEHLAIGEGNYDFQFLLNCIEKNRFPMATLETPRKNLYSLSEDLINSRKLSSWEGLNGKNCHN